MTRPAVTWSVVDAASRYRAGDLRSRHPTQARRARLVSDGPAFYGGKADDLQDRLVAPTSRSDRTVGSSAFRPCGAEHLGFASSADVKTQRIRLTSVQLAAMRKWIESCRVA